MPFIIRRITDHKYATGRTAFRADFVDDINKARVFPTRGNATTSLRNTFNRKDWRNDLVPQAEESFEILQVHLEVDA